MQPKNGTQQLLFLSHQMKEMEGNSFESHVAHWAELISIAAAFSEPDTSLHCKTTDMGLVTTDMGLVTTDMGLVHHLTYVVCVCSLSGC